MLIIGIILALIGAIGINGLWSKNEWRIPVFEVSSALERVANPQVSEMHSGFKRGVATMVVILYGLYLAGACLLYVRHTRAWLLVVVCLIALWLLKAVVGLVRAGYSRKVRLLNYLYSPYVLAWRRDHWSDFTYQQIAAAICEAAGIDASNIKAEEDSLDSFLLALCRHARPAYESERYPKMLEDLKQQAAQMVWGG